MTTINQACKAIVANAICQDYLADTAFPCVAGNLLAAVYNAEYGSYNGTTPKACTSYLQGLPSLCTVPFHNGEILELLAAQGVTRKSESAKDKLIADYWNACGYQFYKLVK